MVCLDELEVKCSDSEDAYLFHSGDKVTLGMHNMITKESGELALYVKDQFSADFDMIQYVIWGDFQGNLLESAIEEGLWEEGMMLSEIPDNLALVYTGMYDSDTDWSTGPSSECLVTSVKDNILDEGMNVYPNPVSDVVTLVFAEELSADMLLNITDKSGRKVYTGAIQRGKKEYQIDLQALTPGVYLMNLNGKDLKKVLEMIKI